VTHGIEINNIVARSIQRRVLTRRIRDASNTTSDIYSTSSKIANNNNSRVVDDKIDKYPRSFIFDVFAKNNDELINNGQLPAKRRRRASFASSSIRIKQARTPLVANLLYDVKLYAGFTRKEEIIKDHE
jgi:hypothetical protein